MKLGFPGIHFLHTGSSDSPPHENLSMAGAEPVKKHPRIFYGWWVVIACTSIILYNGGMVVFGFTAIFEPVTREFGWSYAQISVAASLRGLEIGLLSPLAGYLVDRIGSRKLVIGGNLIIFCGLMLLSRMSSLATFYTAYVLISIGMSFCHGAVLVTAVTNWFQKKVGIATGLLMSGMGFGGLMVPLVTKLIDTLQWRTAMLVLGAGVLLFSLPLALVIRQNPEKYGYQPDGEPAGSSSDRHSPSPATDKQGMTASSAVRGRIFWQIAISSMLHSCSVGAVTTHIMPYLGSIGIARSTASMIALLIPLVSVPSRIGAGLMGDRIDRRYIYISGFLTLSLGSFLFSRVDSTGLWLLVPFVLLFAYGWGSNVTSRVVLMREYYGRRSFGTIVGLVSGIQMTGHIFGPPSAGWFYDTYGTYDGAWLGIAGITAVGMLLVLALPSVKKHASVHGPAASKI